MISPRFPRGFDGDNSYARTATDHRDISKSFKKSIQEVPLKNVEDAALRHGEDAVLQTLEECGSSHVADGRLQTSKRLLFRR